MNKFIYVVLATLFITGCHSDDDGLATVMPVYTCDTSIMTTIDLTQVGTSLTPRANADAEWLSLESSGEFIAPQDIYQRVVAELTTIRATYPKVEQIQQISCYAQVLEVKMDDASYAAAEAGNYTAWDALNQNLRVTGQSFFDSFQIVSLEFEGRYNMQRVADAYADLQGVLSTTPSGVIVLVPDDICLAIRNFPQIGLHYYIFRDGLQFIYYGYEVDTSGNIRSLGIYDSASQSSPPQWYNALQDCRAFL